MSSLLWCEVCKSRPAQLHITRILEGKIFSLHICPECAHDKGFSGSPGGSALETILENANEAAQKASEEAQEASDAVCSGCGKTEENFRESGILGCGQCYDAFGRGLETLMSRIQRDSRHVGKTPLRSGSTAQVQATVEELREQLKEAVKKEDFESAARIRDRIHDIEKSDSGEEPS